MWKLESFSKMAQPSVFHVGELVGYRDMVCLIRSINVTNHGFNVFELENIDEDETYLAYKHQLVKAIDLPTLDQEGDFAEILLAPQPEASIATGEPAVPAPAPLKHQDPAPLQPKPRFATLTEAEVDSVASARTAKNTNEVCFYCVHSMIFPWKCIWGTLSAGKARLRKISWSNVFIDNWRCPGIPLARNWNENEADLKFPSQLQWLKLKTV